MSQQKRKKSPTCINKDYSYKYGKVCIYVCIWTYIILTYQCFVLFSWDVYDKLTQCDVFLIYALDHFSVRDCMPWIRSEFPVDIIDRMSQSVKIANNWHMSKGRRNKYQKKICSSYSTYIYIWAVELPSNSSLFIS